ncbi:MAG: response regulator transcription factor [Lewinellaceae bacterium]|nr:response regulator transcription factor [Lewinellaceae bacterium]
MSIRIAIVEDDDEIRKLTCSILNFYPDLECVGVFGSGEEFSDALSSLKIDVALMDIGLPGLSGIECVRRCHPFLPATEFIMFTDHTDSREVFEALAAGASGYVLKGGLPEHLAEAIREVHAGGSPMSRQIARMVAGSFSRTESQFPKLEKLTPQEQEVLKYLDKGLSYKEIASEKFVSEHTIRSQVRSIYQKLEVHTRTEALNKVHGRK